MKWGEFEAISDAVSHVRLYHFGRKGLIRVTGDHEVVRRECLLRRRAATSGVRGGELSASRIKVQDMLTTRPAPAGGALTIIPMAEGDGVHLHGEVDLATMPVFQSALDKLVTGEPMVDGGLPRGAVPCGDVHLDLARLHFVDLSGASMLVATATRLGTERRLVLHDPPPVLSQILDGFWSGVARVRVKVL